MAHTMLNGVQTTLIMLSFSFGKPRSFVRYTSERFESKHTLAAARVWNRNQSYKFGFLIKSVKIANDIVIVTSGC
jgi:hypothetical protein